MFTGRTDQLHLTAVTVQTGHCSRRYSEIIGREIEVLVGSGIGVLDPSKRSWGGVCRLDASQRNGLITPNSTRRIHLKGVPGSVAGVGLGAGDKRGRLCSARRVVQNPHSRDLPNVESVRLGQQEIPHVGVVKRTIGNADEGWNVALEV